MLAAGARLRRRREFTSVVGSGARVRSGVLVVHLAPAAHAGPARIGFAVGRPVGPAVVRNRVRRRLRHAARPLLAGLPDGTAVVVRALPTAAAASYASLAGDLAAGLRRALTRAGG